MIPVYDSQSATLTLPLPLAGAITAVVVLILAVALVRSNGGTTLVRIAMVAILAVAAWRVFEGIGDYTESNRRAALEARAVDVGAMVGRMPTLACLDGFTGETVTAGCENAVFASPQSVAAALSYTAARLAVVMDGAIASGSVADAEGAANEGGGLARLRRGLEQDTFGFLAHLLETRDQCTREACAAFAALRDAGRVQANLTERVFEELVKRQSANWADPGAKPGAQADSSDAGATTAATTAGTSRANFPSASSIPAISIMTAEPPPPATPSASAAPPAETQPRPRAAPRPTPSPRARGGERTSAPLPLQSAPQAAPEPPRPQ